MAEKTPDFFDYT
jgi:glycerol-3-phosphate dehydrogenase